MMEPKEKKAMLRDEYIGVMSCVNAYDLLVSKLPAWVAQKTRYAADSWALGEDMDEEGLWKLLGIKDRKLLDVLLKVKPCFRDGFLYVSSALESADDGGHREIIYCITYIWKFRKFTSLHRAVSYSIAPGYFWEHF